MTTFVQQPPAAIAPHEDQQWICTHRSAYSRVLLYCDPRRLRIASFTVGDITYRVRRPLDATYDPPLFGRPGRFTVPALGKYFVGHGSTFDHAQEDWQNSVDYEIQRVLGMLPFELTESDKDLQSLLEQHFDLNSLRYDYPITSRQAGKLVSTYPRPIRVQWIDGSSSTLLRSQIPSEMVGYKVGQPFDAVVQRDARSGEILKVTSVFRRRDLDVSSVEEAEAMLKDVTTTLDFPELPWD